MTEDTKGPLPGEHQQMNEREPTEKEGAVESRRKIIRAGMAVPPVLATLASRPVNAVQGLSNMLSGNTSACRGDNFYGGMSPGFWKTPNGNTYFYGDNVRYAWSIAGYDYGNLKSGEDGNQWDDYEGGTTYKSVFGDNDGRPIRVVLNQDPGGDKFHLIAGLLNASYFENKAGSGSGTKYFMTVSQYWDMYNSDPHKLASLIEAAEDKGPGSDCP